MAARIETHKYTIDEAFRECFYIVPDYQREYVWKDKEVLQLLEDSLVELTKVGQNTSISRVNEKLASFPAWNAASIEKRHGLLMALARDVWETTPIDV